MMADAGILHLTLVLLLFCHSRSIVSGQGVFEENFRTENRIVNLDTRMRVLMKKAPTGYTEKTNFLEDAKLECEKEGARLPSYTDLHEPGFYSFLREKKFQSYKRRIGMISVLSYHGFYILSANDTVQLLWICSQDLFLTYLVPRQQSNKQSFKVKGCGNREETMTPTDIVCIRYTYPTTTAQPTTSVTNDYKVKPCLQHAQQSLDTWDAFLIQYRWALLAGTALCILCLVVLAVLLIAVVRRSKLRYKSATSGAHSESPSAGTHMGYEDAYIPGHNYGGEPLMAKSVTSANSATLGRVVHVPSNEMGAISMRRYRDTLRRSSGCLLPNENQDDLNYMNGALPSKRPIPSPSHQAHTPSPPHTAQFYPMPLVPTTTPSSALPVSRESDVL